MTTIREYYIGGVSKNPPPNSPIMFLGIECEIESIAGYGKIDANVWNPTNDGSLRNNGMEFISCPLPVEKALPSFEKLHSTLSFKNPSEKFSPRTSTHVHVNVLDFTKEQVKTFVLLYALYEECFFALVDANRRHNIHCVPLTETYLPQIYHRDLDGMLGNWHKYTAFNLLPVSRQGTVEFRHLQGTSDVSLLSEWVGTINNLWHLVKSGVTLDAMSLTNPDNISQWFDKLFSGTRAYQLKPNLSYLIRNTLIDIKLSTIGGKQ